MQGLSELHAISTSLATAMTRLEETNHPAIQSQQHQHAELIATLRASQSQEPMQDLSQLRAFSASLATVMTHLEETRHHALQQHQQAELTATLMASQGQEPSTDYDLKSDKQIEAYEK